jgi:hypothetical protein
MSALLQKHLDKVQQDWEQGMGEHLKVIERNLQQHHPEEYRLLEHGRQESVLSGKDESAKDQMCSKASEHDAQSLASMPLSTSKLHAAMLEERISFGKVEAEENALGAGFMGGSGTMIKLVWLMLGMFTVVSRGKILITILPQMSTAPLAYAHKIVSTIGSITSGVFLCVRCYFLHVGKPRAAYHALIASLGCASCLFVPVHSLATLTTLFGGCGWMVEGVQTNVAVFLADKASCRPHAVVNWCGQVLGCSFMFRFAQLLYQMQRTEAFVALSWALTLISMAFVHGIVYIVAMGLPQKGLAVSNAVFTVLLMGGVSFMWYKRRSARRQSWLVVQEDAGAYAEEWSSTLESSGEVLGSIGAAVMEVKQDIKASALCQDASASLPSKWRVPVYMVTPAPVSKNQAASMQRILVKSSMDANKNGGMLQFLPSLPLLYAQAFALNNHFQSKCAGWATSIGEHKATTVKKQNRAIQKLWRTYMGNPRLLTDLVRSSIICDTPSDLLAVLDCIRGDPSVGILRIKNRFDPEYDPSLSAGYRNISLNLIVVDEHTSRTCTDSHICELQLSLRAFDNFKTEGGHKRFVSFRDKRAE